MVVGEDRGGHSRQLDLRGVGRLEDLVAELKLDRASQRRELASRRPGADEIVERRGGAEPPRRALLRALVADEADGPAERDRLRRHAGEFLRAVSYVDEDQRDEVLQAFRIAEHVRPSVERISQKSLERLEESAGSARVGEDVRLEALVSRIGRG